MARLAGLGSELCGNSLLRAMGKPILPNDFLDLLAEFESANVRYMIIGGYAVGFHDRPRTTKDLDVLLDDTADNIAAACSALRHFGAPESIVTALATSQSDEIVWLGNPPLRIDLLQSLPGVIFADAYPRRIREYYDETCVDIIGMDDLIESKRAAGRPQDQVDAKHLMRARDFLQNQ